MTITMTIVHLNNSGGSDWLSFGDLDSLAKRGWDVAPSVHQSRLYSRAERRIMPFEISRLLPESEARAEFTDVTGYTGDETGCECCGSPFWFHEEEPTAEDIAKHPHAFGRLEGAAAASLTREIALGEMRGEDVSLLKRALEFGTGLASQEASETRSKALNARADAFLARIGEPT